MQNAASCPFPPTDSATLMTTGEVAAYLRLRERTIYEMVARQTIPFTRATGKILFPRRLIDAWLEAQTELPDAGIAPAAPIYAGSNDPLLEWALRQSGSGLAVLAGGSMQGLNDLAAGRAIMSGLHLIDPDNGAWNIAAARAHLPGSRHVMIHWARRTQGSVAGGRQSASGHRGLPMPWPAACALALRSEGAGSQRLLDVLLARRVCRARSLSRPGSPPTPMPIWRP